jgi:phosphoribosylanthranilate isomerase
LPSQLSVLCVVRAGTQPPTPLPARVLFEGPMSGTGLACDWEAARALARRTELVLAGGLTAGNVAAAISAVQPFGVDVSSGVEERHGIKSPRQIARFVEAARQEGKS